MSPAATKLRAHCRAPSVGAELGEEDRLRVGVGASAPAPKSIDPRKSPVTMTLPELSMVTALACWSAASPKRLAHIHAPPEPAYLATNTSIAPALVSAPPPKSTGPPK